MHILRTWRLLRRGRGWALAGACAALPAAHETVGGQQPAAAPVGTVEAGVGAAQVTDAFGNWQSAYLRAALRLDGATVLLPEVVTSQEFRDHGTLLALGATRTLNEDWYAFGSVGTSVGGFYLPRLHATAMLNRKLLSSRQLVVNGGASYFEAKDGHRDVAVSAGGAYYFGAPWIVEGGTSWNSSHPGNVQSQSYFGAITEGRLGEHYLILRAGGGREAYQILSQGNAISDFRSTVLSLTWRQWLTHGGGVMIAAERYDNPYYRRTGLALGGFWDIK
jgi:YaiO family outer membrane protein